MGFLFAETTGNVDKQEAREDEVLHRLQCRACPLDKIRTNKHPHMEPTGSDKPLVYILGEAPGAEEDEEGQQFVGESGRLLRANVPRGWMDKLRFNNVVRTRPPKNRTPERIEIECCRPSVEADIERTKPKAIFGFGNVPLHWVSGYSAISLWRGRRMPVKIGKHVCWYYPMFHPAFLIRQRRFSGVSEEQRMFQFDLKRAFAEILDLPQPWVPDEDAILGDIEIIDSCDASALRRLEVLLGDAAKADEAGLDYETNGLRPYGPRAKILSAAIDTECSTFAFPFDHSQAKWSDAHRRDLQELWITFLRRCKAKKIVHNLAFELEWTGVKFLTELLRAGRWEDTQSEACILDERKGANKPGCFSLEWLVQQYFGFNIKKMSKVNRSALDKESLSKVLKYNGLDARGHRWLHRAQMPLIEEFGLTEAYELALRRVPTVVLSQMLGVPVDQKVVTELQDKYSDRIKKIEAQIKNQQVVRDFLGVTGRVFNPMSNPDALKVFNEMLQCPEVRVVDKWSKQEKLSVDVDVLTAIARRHPLAQNIIDLRQAHKRKSTYLDPLSDKPEYADKSVLHPDGLLHATFNTTFAETGRLSAEGPNLQNFPKREEEAKEVRRCVIPAPGCVVVALDYGQIEARVIAMFTKDKAFCKALWERYDVHMEWAQILAHAYPARIGGKKNLTDKKAIKDFRTDIKNQWTFPLFFGAKLESAAGYLSIPPEVLKPHYNAFWKQFAGVREWQEQTYKFYEEYGYVECLTGRRRRGPLSLNQVFNTPVQGTAAEIVLDAMSRLSETGNPELQPEINIHDDLTFLRVPADQAGDVSEKIVKIMLATPFDWINVPITVEMAMGPNWLDMKGVANFSSDGKDEWFDD